MVKGIDEMLHVIDQAIILQYEEIKRQGKILLGIEEVDRQIRFQNPGLAQHIKRRMMEIAKERGDLP